MTQASLECSCGRFPTPERHADIIKRRYQEKTKSYLLEIAWVMKFSPNP